MSCHDCDNEITIIVGPCDGCGEHICEECSTDLAVPFQTCPTLFEVGESLGLIKVEEYRCGCCLYSLLDDILRKSKGKVRERVLEEILKELIYFSDDLVSTLIFPEQGQPLRDPDHFDWSKYGRFVDDPFDLIQVGDEIIYSNQYHSVKVTSKEGGTLKFKGGSVKSSLVMEVKRYDKDWPCLYMADNFRTVWLHKTRQNDK